MKGLIQANSAFLPLADESVQMCVTSPPYWSLRNYGIPGTYWPAMKYTPMSGVPEIEIPEMECVLGDEPDPAAYVGHLVFVAREIWRVLKQDGTFWLNLGDT